MMDAIEIRSYKDEDFDEWNNFVSTAKNGTFLFRRDFMDYHKDRFDDFSLLIYNNSQLVAILPGHLKNNEFHSHQGLTYGGILISQDLRMTVFFDIVSEVLRFLCEKSIPFFYWKEIPYFYTQFPSDEWKYLMFITNAELYRRDLCAVVELKKDYALSKSMIRNAKVCAKSGFSYKACDLWETFWKEILYFYNQFPSDEWKYLMFITNAELYRRDLCAVIEPKSNHAISKSKVRDAKTGANAGLYYKECDLWETFWKEILEPELLLNHNAKPVHSLEEILLLKSKFKDNIHLYAVFLNDEMVGGTVLFTHRTTVHSQYISVKSQFKNKKVLDFLYYKLLTEVFSNYDYLDFGISNEDNGRKLNKGLLFWKEGFGARGVSQDFYKISTHNYNLIEQMYV